jgi:hypothetical protein
MLFAPTNERTTMPRNYNAKNTRATGGKVSTGPKQPKCKTCADAKQVRVSKRRPSEHNSPAKQQYDIVWEKCPDC